MNVAVWCVYNSIAVCLGKRLDWLLSRVAAELHVTETDEDFIWNTMEVKTLSCLFNNRINQLLRAAIMP